MDDLQQFKQTYITECFELLSDMEELLLRLDEETSIDDLNAIFRCAHSIKGGAGAFGFDQIANFTHILETLLDEMREGKIAASNEIVDTLLKAQGIVLHMVSTANEDSSLPSDFGADIAQELERIAGMEPSVASVETNSNTQSDDSRRKYTIFFKPMQEMLVNGNEPLLLLRELASLGELEINTDDSALPSLDKLDPEVCYLKWDFTLLSDEPLERIKEVFEFVEDDCELTINTETVAQTTEQKKLLLRKKRLKRKPRKPLLLLPR